ncbi:RNA methyltransferase [Oxalobacteraceae bacterium R-40]|uniref:RNA methyltransferase n=1 Tax=Keguizhuia sedimenti TaxID=3064264 RepID=A0ABU1BRP3_9BURK|nr:RNA methyltransferase [Oxalobacteraceae bacterium R-40]
MSSKYISSRDNPVYKELRQLAESSQARRKAGRTLLDGVHLCDAYLQHCGKPVLCAVSENSQAHSEVAAVFAKCSGMHVNTIVLSDALYRGIQVVEHGVGILFLIDTPRLNPPDSLTVSAVLLDGVQDPGNLGSILRSAAAAGIRSAFCGSGTAFAWSPKVLRAGMGAHFVVNIYENADLKSLVRGASVPVIATSSHATHSLYDLDLRGDAAWLMGHEGQGVSEDLMSLVTRRVQIPHAGPIESLNVAASAAVCFFEQLRQRRNS